MVWVPVANGTWSIRLGVNAGVIIEEREYVQVSVRMLIMG